MLHIANAACHFLRRVSLTHCLRWDVLLNVASPGEHRTWFLLNREYLFRYGDPSISGRESPSLEDDYIQPQPPGRQGVYGATTGRGAIGPLPPSHPTPISRLIVRDLKLLLTLNQEEHERPPQPGLCKDLDSCCCTVHAVQGLSQ